MLWIVLALLLVMGMFGLYATYSLIGGVSQIIVICSLAIFAIRRIGRMRAGCLLWRG